MIFKVIIVILLILLCALVRMTNHNLVCMYDLLADIKKTEDGMFNHVKCIEKELEITGDKWVNLGEELKDVFEEEGAEGNEASN